MLIPYHRYHRRREIGLPAMARGKEDDVIFIIRLTLVPPKKLHQTQLLPLRRRVGSRLLLDARALDTDFIPRGAQLLGNIVPI